MKKNKIICWWSGGVTSAVACKLSIDLYGKEKCRVIFIDTDNEHLDTYRFLEDCSRWYDMPIETITGLGKGDHASGNYNSIEDVWVKHKSLNVAHGAICSYQLKRVVREKWEKNNEYTYQVFGFDIDEPKRAKSMKMNNGRINPIFPLLLHGLTKKDCIDMIEQEGIEVPEMYRLGFQNNNCFGKTTTSIGGCVQGGIGYWQKMAREYPEKFRKMGEMEHKLTDLKGKPVTMLKDQGKDKGLVFLLPHPDYPHVKDISMMKGREVKPLMECNGFCGINDLEDRSETETEINYNQIKLF
tara:strand:+ start:460 stop:1353 length:894 start_codon:yes stop_codon:yes gene_type:complete